MAERNNTKSKYSIKWVVSVNDDIECFECGETGKSGETWKTNNEKIRLLWLSQSFAIGETIKNLWDMVRKADFDLQEKTIYCGQLKKLYRDVEEENLHWEELQKVVFLSGMADKIKQVCDFKAGQILQKLKDQWVMLLLHQLSDDEGLKHA